MSFRRQQIVGIAMAVGLALSTAAPISAQLPTGLPVIDVAANAQVAAQAWEVILQLQSMERQVAALRAAALQLDPRSFQSVQALLAGNTVGYDALLRDVRTIGYTLENVNRRYHQLFPDEAALKTMSPAQHRAASRQMNAEIHASALVAARSQSTLRDIEANNREARNILSRSESNGSQVAQLQSAVQMLGLIHQNLVGINQTLSASTRVASNVAVRGVTERRIQRERVSRMLRAPATPERIPEVSDKVRF